MCVYLIDYSSAKSVIDKFNRFGVEKAKQLFNHFNYDEGFPEGFKSIIQEVLDEKMDTGSAYDYLLDEAVSLLEKEEMIDWSEVMGCLGRTEVFSVMERFQSNMSDEDYWMLIGYCYTTGDFCYNDYETLKRYLNSNRPNREFVMNEDDRKVFLGLPDSFKVYRGCSVKEIEGGELRYSWSLSRDVADFFAHEFVRNKNTDCEVVERIVQKEDVLGYFNSRKEQEILLIPRRN